MNSFLRLLVAPALCLLIFATANAQKTAVARPSITGIARVQISTIPTNLAATRDFYVNTLRLGPSPARSGCDNYHGNTFDCLTINNHQKIQLVIVPQEPSDRPFPVKVVFATADVSQMRRYLISKGFSPQPIFTEIDQTQHFDLLDPDDHQIGFAQLSPSAPASTMSPDQPSAELIHAGFIVRNRSAEDHFYKDILGFHAYWHGGRNDSETDWLGMQVSEGTQWLEYMLNVSPDASHHTLGVMNHIALGVVDIKAANQQLLKNGWKASEEPKIGRDGKWQLNLYDPDETRVEFMEFKPVQEPCCSPYTGPHPGPNQ